MEDYRVNELRQKLNQFPLLSQYLGPSLQERITRDDWFENRIIISLFRGGSLIQRLEKTFKEAELQTVDKCERIFCDLKGVDCDYDEKLFDVLTEVRLVRWARENGYQRIKKIPADYTEQTPDFFMERDGEITIAEAKNFRDREFLPAFFQDRLVGLAWKMNYSFKFGITVETTAEYDRLRDDILSRREEYKQAIRDEITEEWLNLLEDRLPDCTERVLNIGGLFAVSRNNELRGVNVGWSFRNIKTPVEMLDKLGGNLKSGIKQIKVYVLSGRCAEIPTNALVFLSGTDDFHIEWDDVWEALCHSDDSSARDKAAEIYREVGQLIDMPFRFIVGKGNPVEYVDFPWPQTSIS